MMTARKVLVADDEIHIVHVVTIKLRNNGYEVLSAENGDDAFKLACEEKPDIIVTDYQMPGMTGVELVRKLRQNETTKDMPVIMLTARGFAVEDKEVKELGISELLSKPFSPKELLRSIEDILYQRSVMQK
ncbi:MAG: response regulator [Phycisphaerae bacterium]|nr:response regulator [Phycisphaerae bacterium]MDD5381247.1 response regulator [Phycisphaerae bacterium]